MVEEEEDGDTRDEGHSHRQNDKPKYEFRDSNPDAPEVQNVRLLQKYAEMQGADPRMGVMASEQKLKRHQQAEQPHEAAGHPQQV